MKSRVLVLLLAILCCVAGVPAPAVAQDDRFVNVGFSGFREAQTFDVAIDPKHRPVAVGTAVEVADDNSRRSVWTMVRYGPDGQRDRSFGTRGGKIADFVPFDGTAQAVSGRPGGGYYVAGAISDLGQFGYAIAAVQDDGSLDTSWGDGGTVSQLGNQRRAVNGLSVDPGGAVVLLTTSVPEGQADVVTYRADGTFRSDVVGRHRGVDRVDDELRLPDGRFYSAEYDHASGAVKVAAFHADGSPDRSFGRRGLARHVPAADFDASAIRAGGGGRLLVAGLLEHGDARRWALLRLRADGSVDRRFGDQGLARIGPQSGRPAAVSDVRRLPSGRILVIGRANADLRVRAVDPDGTMASGFREIHYGFRSMGAAVAVNRGHIFTAGWIISGSRPSTMLLVTRFR